MSSVESRLSKIDRELKALKSVYMVAGGNINLVVQKSQTFTINATSNTPFKIKFTPNKGQPYTITTLQPLSSSDSFIYSNRGYENVPQTGDGSVIIQLGTHSTGTVTVQIVAIGTSSGTFSVV